MLIKLLKMAIGLVVVAFMVIAGVAFGCNPAEKESKSSEYDIIGATRPEYLEPVEFTQIGTTTWPSNDETKAKADAFWNSVNEQE